MKSYTDIEQSKKLAEILPLESADMCYSLPCEKGDKPLLEQGGFGSTPCWSLAAMLNHLREIDLFPEIDADELGVTMIISYYEDNGKLLSPVHDILTKADNLVDACYKMVLKLKENNLL